MPDTGTMDEYCMRLNIFRNPFIDVQARFLLDAHADGIRKQTEDYWRNAIADEIMRDFAYLPNITIIAEKIRKHG
jgi:hypothetical protein